MSAPHFSPHPSGTAAHGSLMSYVAGFGLSLALTRQKIDYVTPVVVGSYEPEALITNAIPALKVDCLLAALLP